MKTKTQILADNSVAVAALADHLLDAIRAWETTHPSSSKLTVVAACGAIIAELLASAPPRVRAELVESFKDALDADVAHCVRRDAPRVVTIQ